MTGRSNIEPLCLRLIRGCAATAFVVAVFQSPAWAASKAEFDKAYADAIAVQAEAGKIKNQWTSTQDALDAAKKAADAGDFQKGERQAALAKAMAAQSIAQAAEQNDAWRTAVIGGDASNAKPSEKKAP